jgi:hypothetical protein
MDEVTSPHECKLFELGVLAQWVIWKLIAAERECIESGD